MIKKSGYTLLELLVVIVIIGLLAAFGIPAFAKYGRATEASQKAEEINELFNQVRSLSLNPENTNVTSYRISFDKSTLSKHFYVLKSCVKTESDDCTGSIEIRKITLLKEQSILLSVSGSWLVDCKTKLVDGKVVCTKNIAGNNIDIYSDNNRNVLKKFTLVTTMDPYSVNITTSDL